MNKENYRFANTISSALNLKPTGGQERLSDAEIRNYSEAVLKQICGMDIEAEQSSAQSIERERKAKKGFGRAMKYTAAAACTVLLLCATVFGENVHAAIEHIRWSLENAFGLTGSLENYRDIINNSAADHGYVVTLQEVAAADSKLVVNYTIQREDGLSMGEIPMFLSEQLYINGKEQFSGASGGAGFLDDEHTVVGVSLEFDVLGIDMAQENTYRLCLENYETKEKGKWDFVFTADGSELIADTKRVPIGKEFVLEDGATVVLEEMTLNELEQRITYHVEGASDTSVIFRLDAVDSDGKQAMFDTKIFQGKSGDGYMQNAEVLFDGRIDPNADRVTFTLYATSIPEESGRMDDAYVQVGESFELQLNN